MNRSFFKEKKTTQAAIFLIRKNGGSINYTLLLKLLYLADRSSLAKRGRPITYDNFVSMDNGPVLSNTYDLIKNRQHGEYWNQKISAPYEYSISVIQEDDIDELSPAELGILSEIHSKFGNIPVFQLIGMLHDILPEWKDPKGSSLPISYGEVLKASGWEDEDIHVIESELDELAKFESMMK